MFDLYPCFQVILVQTRRALTSSRPIMTYRRISIIIRNVIDHRATRPTLIIRIRVNRIKGLWITIRWLLQRTRHGRQVVTKLYSMTFMLRGALKERLDRRYPFVENVPINPRRPVSNIRSFLENKNNLLCMTRVLPRIRNHFTTRRRLSRKL